MKRTVIMVLALSLMSGTAAVAAPGGQGQGGEQQPPVCGQPDQPACDQQGQPQDNKKKDKSKGDQQGQPAGGQQGQPPAGQTGAAGGQQGQAPDDQHKRRGNNKNDQTPGGAVGQPQIIPPVPPTSVEKARTRRDEQNQPPGGVQGQGPGGQQGQPWSDGKDKKDKDKTPVGAQGPGGPQGPFTGGPQGPLGPKGPLPGVQGQPPGGPQGPPPYDRKDKDRIPGGGQGQPPGGPQGPYTGGPLGPLPGVQGGTSQGRARWSRGERLPQQYRQDQYFVSDWQRNNLPPPPRGYRWMCYDRGNCYMVALDSGYIRQSYSRYDRENYWRRRYQHFYTYNDDIYYRECRSRPDPAGILIGGLIGGLIGRSIGDDRAGPTFAGIIIGGAIGAALTRDLDCEDRNYAYHAYYDALNDGRTRRVYPWRNPHNNHRGEFSVRSYYYDDDGFRCANYRHDVWLNRQRRADGRACRQPDGAWAFLN
jgi:Ni/Co efflux regulator RcnB/surface antigen